MKMSKRRVFAAQHGNKYAYKIDDRHNWDEDLNRREHALHMACFHRANPARGSWSLSVYWLMQYRACLQ